MKKILALCIVTLLVFALCFFPALAEKESDGVVMIEYAQPSADVTVEAPDEGQTEIVYEHASKADKPYTWEYLATIAGATAATLLIVQFLKLPVDKVFGKVPTRIVAYVIALVLMLVATAFTTGITASGALLAAVNAFVVALAAMGSYEITFAKIDRA